MKAARCFLQGALLSIAPTLGMSHPCPPNAEDGSAPITIAVARANGQLLTNNDVVEPGETIFVRMAAIFLPDALRPMAAFEGGMFTITISGNTTNVTPPQGIPVIGPESCGGLSAVMSTSVRYTVSNNDLEAGIVVIQADYTGGIAHLETDWPVESHIVGTIPVVSRLTIRTLSTGAVLLQFVGVPSRTYHIEATTDLDEWIEIGTVLPDADGACRFEDKRGMARYTFYRYAQAATAGNASSR